MARESQSQTLIFMHMPKSGGSTMNHILDWNYKHAFSMTVHKRIPIFIALPEDEKRRLQCLKGTAYYGIHRHLSQPATYATIMRHPVSRTLSHYFYYPKRLERMGKDPIDWTLEEFIEDMPFQTSYQLRMLVGAEHDDIERMLRDPLPPDAVEIAKRHLDEHFSVAGVMDYYDETLLIMKQTYGWDRAFYARQNVNPKRNTQNTITDAQKAWLTELCAPEIEVYEYVKARIEAEISDQDEDFQRELAKLRQANRRFELLRRATQPIYGTPLWHWLRNAARLVKKRG